MNSCLTALLMFLSSHNNDSTALGWTLGDHKTWAYIWVHYTDGKYAKVHYFAFNHIPKDSSVRMKETGLCKLENNKVVKILEYTR